jgi:hypothetical protein
VKVTLWGRNVGELYWDAHDRCAYFNYFPEFVARGLDIAPLTASITKPALRHGEVYKGNKDKLYQGLPEFLADSLPDDWGKRVMRHWQSQYDRNVSLTPVDALSLMGKLSSARARLTDKNWRNIDGGVEPTYVIDTTNGYDGFYDFEAISNIISSDVATTITAPAAHGGTAAVWYMLDGRRLTGRSAEGRLQGKKPAQRGIYIYNSKKVVVK